MSKPKVLILRAAGTNCDFETQYAFEKAGAEVERVHINRVLDGKVSLNDYQIMAIPGGFTYGDDIAAGKILANELYFNLKAGIDEFVNDGKLIIGICNGFQVMVKAGLLPGLGIGPEIDNCRVDNPFDLDATLTFNDSGRFEDRWVYLKACSGKSPFVNEGDDIFVPVANAEGKFVTRDAALLSMLDESGQVVYRYVDKDGVAGGQYPANPSGSLGDVAGICDPTGRIFGLMPHPERHVDGTQHPRWTREGLKEDGEGLTVFKNAVEYVKNEWL